MPIVRIHAFSIRPTAWGQPVNITGGEMPLRADLDALITGNIERASFPNCLDAKFKFDDDRNNQIRDSIIKYGFGSAPDASDAAQSLAEHLAHAMDMRSKPCLFVICASAEGDTREITVWTFPREDAIRLNAAGQRSRIEILTDVFSQSSHYRKACWYRGTNARTQFLGGKILDFQAKQAKFQIARFWIEDFLHSELELSPAAGTKILAETLKRISAKSPIFEDQKQIHAAAISVRNAQRKRWTPADFADHYFDERLAERFLNELPNRDSRRMLFDFDRSEFDDRLGFSTYELEQGVIVSAPFDEVGKSVRIGGDDDQTLVCEGRIRSEKVRSRRYAG